MRVITWLFCSLAVQACAFAETRLVGSDLLGPTFVEALTAFGRRDDFSLSVTMAGSQAGMDALAAGQADVAVLLIAPGEKPTGDGLVAVPVAYLAPVVVVPTSLPLAQLALPQLSAIYCEDDRSVLRRWAELGVPGEWAPKPIQAHVTVGEAGLVGDLFRALALRSTRLRAGVVQLESFDAQLARLQREQGGMAVVPATLPLKGGLKILALSRTPEEPAYGPSAENLHSGDYPLRLPVWLVFRKTDTAHQLALLRYLLGEDSVPLWRAAGFVPLPVNVRNQQVFDLELL